MRNAAVGLWLALWKRAAPRARVGDLRVRPIPHDAAMRALLGWRPDWKTDAIAKILRARQGTFVDVGANVGQTLLDFVAAPVRSIYVGFEPNLVCCEHLSRLIASNALADCRVIPAALGDRNGIATLYRCGDVDAGATLRRELRPAADVQESTICMFRLDDSVDVIGGPRLALVKIDAEGAELEVLRGMEATIARHQPWIVCEVLHRDPFADAGAYARRCSELMRLVDSIGYSAFRIVPDDRGLKVRSLEQVSAFPDVVWGEQSATSCDYLFLPSTDDDLALQVLVP